VIVDAARAITAATATLVQSATVAQKELVTKGKAEKSKNLYRRDPAWAKGLISASQAVAGSVKGLVTAANASTQSKVPEEELVASAQGVAAATARLVFASRTKADPFSPTQKKLSAAAKAVAEATKQLVEAAKLANKEVEDRESRPDWDSLGETAQRRAEVEAQTKILRIQKELQMAQEGLAYMRKKDYAEATGKTIPQQQSQQQPRSTPAPAPANNAAPRVRAPTANKNVPKVLPGEKFFTLEQLQKRPPECDPARLDQYLSDEDFFQIFSIDKATFAKQPSFKQTAAKKALGLF